MTEEMPLVVADPSRPGSFMVRVGETDQSYVDLDDPTHLEFDYVQRMADVLDAQAPVGQRLRVIHVGGAGMTLARYLVATRPSSPQIVLEPNEQLTGEVRKLLPLPSQSGIKVRPVDGRSGIAAMRHDYADVVIVDAFVGAQVPAELTTVEFLTDVHRVLVDKGTVMINTTDRGPFDYGRRCAAAARSVFSDVLFSAEPATLKGRRFGNVLIVAAKAELPYLSLARTAASSAFPYRLVRGEHLTQLISGAAPFTDTDSAMSPPPPGGKAFFR